MDELGLGMRAAVHSVQLTDYINDWLDPRFT